MSKSTDIAWAAGFMDGEGCIHISKVLNRGRPAYCLVISASQSRSREPLEKLQRLFGGSIHESIHRQGDRTWPMFKWCLRSVDAKDALTKMIPYLTCKRKQALVAVRFVGLGRSYGPIPQSDSQIEKKERFYLRLQEMKRG